MHPHFAIRIHILNTPPHLAIPVHHVRYHAPLFGRFIISLQHRFRFIIHLNNAPLLGDSVSSYILNMPRQLAIPESSYILNTPPLTWRIRFIIYLKHAPPPLHGESESSYIFNMFPHLSSYIYNTPSHLASPVHNIPFHQVSTTRPKHNDRMMGFKKGNSCTLKQACTA